MNAMNPRMAANEKSEQPIEETPLFKRKRLIIPIFLTVIILMAAAWSWYMQRFSFVSTDDAFVEANRATISSKVLGRITMLKADEGDTVACGDTLVRLDDADLIAQRMKTEAQVRFLSRNIEVADVTKEKALDDFNRIEKQFKSQIVSQEQTLMR